MIDYEGFEQRLTSVGMRLQAILEHHPNARERQLPVTVGDHHRRGNRCFGHAMQARVRAREAKGHKYESAQMDRAFDWLAQAEHEIELADKLIAELEASE